MQLNPMYQAHDWVSRRKVGITGTRWIPPQGHAYIELVIDSLHPDHIIVQGACIGVDTYVAQYARKLGRWVHGVIPADRSRVPKNWMEFCTTYEEMPFGTHYRERNERIVLLSHELKAFPRFEENAKTSRRSGTWMTARIARRENIPVGGIILSTGTSITY